ncbi:Hpt domain-containing protein [Leptolyngbya sp. 7M]|uniref:Hpt domain-containing protein n=1 Tax=Leptolyngbya sp. 7M TaxID=2812896 RepID=UPI001B8C6259|nr:Hpt domain-containing protein [Leptolyngbya sp. 7M]QYO63996.1 Hpt domain-containing protein [Leptolyngbya sp. 7M]QYU69916.1 Hpt domain-containing protein [Leptolyngbya sp. 15MV]
MISAYANDPEMRELVALFVSELPDRVEKLWTAWHAQQAEQVCRMAHQLRGAGSGYGFPALSEAAAKLENDLRRISSASGGAALESVAEQFRELVDICSRARAA